VCNPVPETDTSVIIVLCFAFMLCVIAGRFII